MRTTEYEGLALSLINALSYSTYATVNNGSQLPYLALDVNWSGGTTYDDRLFFEPPYQQPTTGKPGTPNQGAGALNTWQTWDALAASPQPGTRRPSLDLFPDRHCRDIWPSPD